MTRPAKPVKRILIVGSYAVVAALAALVAWQLARQWEPGYSTPARADFPRRLAAEAGGGKRSYGFFYASTRPREDLLDPASTQRADDLSLGSFKASISPALAVGPRAWEDADLLQVLPPEEIEAGEFFGRLRSAMLQSPHRSLLIVVWGWKEKWLSAAAKTAYLAYMLDVDTPVVVFDWPANQGDNARGYLAAGKMAQMSSPALGRLVERVTQEVQPENLWLVALSMGGQVVCDSFDYMAARGSLNDPDKEIAHVVLAAPDVPQDEFDRQFAEQISRLSRHLTVYVSSTDQALLLSQWINRGTRLGRTSVAQAETGEPQFLHAERLLKLEAEGSREIDVVDVTPINRHRNRHHFLTDDPEFLDELYLRLLHPDEPTNRRLYPLGTDPGVVSWILWDQ